ncbi:MAG: hypothetical protein CMI60_23820 [Parvibaculum sp.]|nr:hypothetical protein [Parvibaculum sp.]
MQKQLKPQQQMITWLLSLIQMIYIIVHVLLKMVQMSLMEIHLKDTNMIYLEALHLTTVLQEIQQDMHQCHMLNM